MITQRWVACEVWEAWCSLIFASTYRKAGQSSCFFLLQSRCMTIYFQSNINGIQMKQLVILLALMWCCTSETNAQIDTMHREYGEVKLSKENRRKIIEKCKELTSKEFLDKLTLIKCYDTTCWSGRHLRSKQLQIVVIMHMHGLGLDTRTETYVSMISPLWQIIYHPQLSKKERLHVSMIHDIKRSSIYKHMFETFQSISPGQCGFIPLDPPQHNCQSTVKR